MCSIDIGESSPLRPWRCLESLQRRIKTSRLEGRERMQQVTTHTTTWRHVPPSIHPLRGVRQPIPTMLLLRLKSRYDEVSRSDDQSRHSACVRCCQQGARCIAEGARAAVASQGPYRGHVSVQHRAERWVRVRRGHRVGVHHADGAVARRAQHNVAPRGVNQNVRNFTVDQKYVQLKS
jgi:hypothetical protein